MPTGDTEGVQDTEGTNQTPKRQERWTGFHRSPLAQLDDASDVQSPRHLPAHCNLDAYWPGFIGLLGPALGSLDNSFVATHTTRKLAEGAGNGNRRLKGTEMLSGNGSHRCARGKPAFFWRLRAF